MGNEEEVKDTFDTLEMVAEAIDELPECDIKPILGGILMAMMKIYSQNSATRPTETMMKKIGFAA